jgi:hypothetical protein
MISETLYPRTSQDLVRALQKMRIVQIEIVEPYEPTVSSDLVKTAKEMCHKSGNVTVILLRSK